MKPTDIVQGKGDPSGDKQRNNAEHGRPSSCIQERVFSE